MQGKVDLHIHTVASEDGECTPEEIFEMAGSSGLRAIAFADHDSVASLAEGESLGSRRGVEFIPSLELSTHFEGFDLHLLCYLIDWRSKELNEVLAENNFQRVEQTRRRVQILRELGFSITFQEVLHRAMGRAPTTAAVLKCLLSHAQNRSDPRLHPYIWGIRANSPVLNFYRDYFLEGEVAYVPLQTCGIKEGIELVHKLGGVPILAHPGRLEFRTLNRLIPLGLSGVEVYSSHHDPDQTRLLEIYAREKQLLITAGSDFHGESIKPDVELGKVRNNGYQWVDGLYASHRRGKGRSRT